MHHFHFLSYALLAAFNGRALGFTTTPVKKNCPIRDATDKINTRCYLSSPNKASIDPQEFLERAQKLREEIAAFEQGKDQLEEAEQKQTQAELGQKQAFIDAYSAVIPILKPDGIVVEEAIFFPPTNKAEENVVNSEILVLEIPLPMGILLGQDDEDQRGLIIVDEVAEGTNGEKCGVKEGDVLRACTACRMEMSQPTWQLIAGGIGQPKTFRLMYGADGEPLEQVMEAIGSNRMDSQGRPVVLVLERLSDK